MFGKKRQNFIFAVFADLVYWLGDIFCLFFVFLSFGYLIHFGGLLLGYSVSARAGMAAFIPGGLGVCDGGHDGINFNRSWYAKHCCLNVNFGFSLLFFLDLDSGWFLFIF